MTVVILLVLGLIVGSFLNVSGLRLNSGMSLGGRSQCPSCGHTLRWFELIPVLSFLFLKGRCRECQTKISRQYPAIEILTALVFLSIYNLQFTIFNEFILILVFCLYIALAIYDFRHRIIPDPLVYWALFFSLLYLLFNLQTYKLIDLLAGPILFLFFAAVWLVTSGKAMGFGDAKLSLSVGFLLGAANGFSAIILAFWIGAAFGLVSLVQNKNITMKSEISFAPFIILGAWLSLIFDLDLLHVSLF